MLKPSDVPKAWTEELQRLQAIHSRTVLAGGALRDLDLGLPVKDIDFFVAVGDMSEAERVAKQMGCVEVEEFDEKDEDDTRLYPQSMNEVIMVADLKKKVGGLTGQVVFVNWKLERIHLRFDYSLCQIWYDGTRVKWSSEYEADKKDKILRVVRADNPFALASSVERYVRWQHKFGDYTWVLGVDVSGADGVFF